MLKRFFEIYLVPLMASLTLAIILIAMSVTKEPFTIIVIVLGSLLGTFVLDLDYLVYAYFLEPEADFSKTLTTFIKHGDLINAFTYVYYHKSEVTEKTLNGFLFQIVLAAASILVVSSTTGYFMRVLVLSTLLNSIYRLLENYTKDTSSEWFWALKNKPSHKGVLIITISFIAVLIYCISLF